MSYEASGYSSAAPRRSGRRFDVYAGPPRDRSREYLQIIDDRPRPRRDYRMDRRDLCIDSPRRDFRFGGRRTSINRLDAVYDAGREHLIHERRISRSRPDVDTPRPCKVLGVFGLSTQTAERDLYNIFSEFGHVRDIKMIYDNLTGRSRGFAFVYYDTSDAARRAKSFCDNGLEIDGRLTRVDFSVTQAPHPPTPGVYMGKYKRSLDVGFDARHDRKFSREFIGRNMPSHTGRRAPVSRSRFSASPRIARSTHVALVGSHRRVRAVSSSRSRSPPPVYTQQPDGKLQAASLRRSRSASFGSPLPNAAKQPRIIDQTWPEDVSPNPL